MKIGVVGIGIVGSAVYEGLRRLNHDMYAHDVKYDGSSIKNVLDTEICFICVPTPSNEDGACDISIVNDVVRELKEKNYDGIVAIKSTVVPGTADALAEETGLDVCFVPEFLRERCAITDFTEHHDVCIIGTTNNKVFEAVKECHGHYPSKFVMLTPREAEFCKYFNNVYNAMLIIFANSFYEA